MTEQRPLADLTTHPDMMEMRERYAKILGGRNAVAMDGFVLLTGLYLAISPWVVTAMNGFSRLTVNNLVIGIGVACVGLALRLAPEHAHQMSWTMVAVGIWMIITPWVIGPSIAPVIWNNVCTGAVIMLLGLVATATMMAAGRQHTTT
jgi:hypothetical protein